jgi:predicted CXXCH cytochrome family protein
MTPGNLVLMAAATVSLVAGAMVQSKGPQSLPNTLFSQAKHEDFLGDKKCAECHEDTSASFPKSGHAIYMHAPGLSEDKQGCEACHGPGANHIREKDPQVISYSKISAKEVSDACLRCHADMIKAPHWASTAHARSNVSCVSCHQIHPKEESFGAPAGDKALVKKPVFAAVKTTGKLLKSDEATLCNECHKTEVSQFRLSSHHPVPEGRLVCSDCHSIHPSSKDRLKVHTTKEKCVTCHSDKAGPFAFEHDPVAGWTGGGCGECHRSHGTNNPSLLKSFSRGMCSQCHTDKAANHFLGRTCWSAGCHVAIHGSNTDRRFFTK